MRPILLLLLLATALPMSPAPSRATPQIITFAERELFESPGDNMVAGNLDESPLPELVGVRGGDVLIRRNLGGRRFAESIVVPMASGTLYGPVLADLNGDGRLDLVVWSTSPPALFVRLNQGELTFAPTATYALPNELRAVASGDLNNDSRDDLVVLWSLGLASYLSASDGTLSLAPAQTTNPGLINITQLIGHEIKDVDGDGARDLAISVWRRGEYSFEWYAGTGDGGFAPARPAIQHYGAGSLVDLDRDGDLDRVQFDGTSLAFYFNDSGAFVSSGPISLGRTRMYYEVSVAVGDLDKDGSLDVVLAGYCGGIAQHNSLVVVVYAAMDSLQRHIDRWHVPKEPFAAELADFDGDGFLDVATQCYGRQDNPFEQPGPYPRPTALLWNDGRGVLMGKLEIPLQVPEGHSYDGRGLLAMRLPSGAVPDLLAAAQGNIRLLRNRGDGRFREPEIVGRGVPRASADLNDDGADDLVATRGDSVVVHFRAVAGGGFEAPVLISTTMKFLGLADFDGDGALDLGLEAGDGSLWARPGDGAGGFGQPRDLARRLPTFHGGVLLEDMNSDGRADLAMTEAPSLESGNFDDAIHQGVLHVFLNNGYGTLLSDATDTLAYHGCCAHALRSALASGDVDGDGDVDLVVRMFSSGNSSWFGAFLNNGRGEFEVAGPARDGGAPGGLLVCTDLNGDGLSDLLLHDQDGLDFDFRPFEAIGGGNFGGLRTLVGMHQAGAMVAADFDGDGRTDAAVLDVGDNAVGIMLNVTPFGPTPTQLSLVSARVVDDAIHLDWIAPGPEVFSAQLERNNGAAWTTLATLTSDGLGQVRYRDADVTRGTRYGYRLRYRDGARELLTAESWVELPALTFALRAPSPSPVRGVPAFGVSLPSRGDAALEILDIAGRRVREQRLSGLAPGEHRVALEGAPLSPGLYFARLRLAEASARVRFVVIR